MPVFISYSQKDSGFVDTLAINLVKKKHHIWMDRWELKVGDSLVEKIQEALVGSSAILVILSKNSIQSPWFRRELNSGLVRELEERKTLIIPCIIDDCDIPLFLREKMYADFRRNPDAALTQINVALASISNPHQGRIEQPNFHTDWSLDWAMRGGAARFEWTFVDHGHEWPYVVLSRLLVLCNEVASRKFAAAVRNEAGDDFIREVLALIISSIPPEGLSLLIENEFEIRTVRKVPGKSGQEFLSQISCRRMGQDTGMDTLLHFDNNLRNALSHMSEVNYRPSKRSARNRKKKRK